MNIAALFTEASSAAERHSSITRMFKAQRKPRFTLRKWLIDRRSSLNRADSRFHAKHTMNDTAAAAAFGIRTVTKTNGSRRTPVSPCRAAADRTTSILPPSRASLPAEFKQQKHHITQSLHPHLVFPSLP